MKTTTKKCVKYALIAVMCICIVRMFGTPSENYITFLKELFGAFAYIVILCDYAINVLVIYLCGKTLQRYYFKDEIESAERRKTQMNQ